jgi:hypothetical protein
MYIGTFFWAIWLLCVIFGSMGHWTAYSSHVEGSFSIVGRDLAEFVMMGLLGWKSFGPPLRFGPPPART